MQVRHAKLQARFSGNDESGKGVAPVGACLRAGCDARAAEAKCVDLQRAEPAVPSDKLVLSPAPPKFFVDGTKTCNRAGKDCVLSRSLSGPPSVRAVAGLLGRGCLGRRASQSHPEENTCLTHWHRRTMRHHHQLPDLPRICRLIIR